MIEFDEIARDYVREVIHGKRDLASCRNLTPLTQAALIIAIVSLNPTAYYEGAWLRKSISAIVRDTLGLTPGRTRSVAQEINRLVIVERAGKDSHNPKGRRARFILRDGSPLMALIVEERAYRIKAAQDRLDDGV